MAIEALFGVLLFPIKLNSGKHLLGGSIWITQVAYLSLPIPALNPFLAPNA